MFEWYKASRAERVEWVRARAAENMTSSQVANAAMAAGVTRNVIIGVGNRARPKIVWHGTAKPRTRALPVRRQPVYKPHAMAALEAEAPPEISGQIEIEPFVPKSKAWVPEVGIALVRCGDNDCRWPMFDDEELMTTTQPSELPYCGLPVAIVADGRGRAKRSSFCVYHHARVWTAPVKTRG